MRRSRQRNAERAGWCCAVRYWDWSCAWRRGSFAFTMRQRVPCSASGRNWKPASARKPARDSGRLLPGAWPRCGWEVRQEGRQEGLREGELKGEVLTIEGFLGRDAPWSTIEAATGIDEATFRRLKHQVEAADDAIPHPN